jgi:hypothetical protein
MGRVQGKEGWPHDRPPIWIAAGGWGGGTDRRETLAVLAIWTEDASGFPASAARTPSKATRKALKQASAKPWSGPALAITSAAIWQFNYL